MSSPYSVLPREVWEQVFRSVCPSAGLEVRLVCKDFRDLVDGGSLRSDWTATLRREEKFWAALRRWRVPSVALSCSCGRTGEAGDLLTTVSLDNATADLKSLACFGHMDRLRLEQPKDMKFHLLSRLLPPRLLHLRLCEVSMDMVALDENYMSNILTFDLADHMKNLRSFVCHSVFCANYGDFFPIILLALPRLSHLSVTPPYSGFRPNTKFREQPELQHPLTSLEIIKYVDNVPQGVMKMVPHVRSLTLLFNQHFKMEEDVPICSWLRDLPDLTALSVVRGPPVSKYMGLIPPTVTRLTLRPAQLSPEEMTELSTQLPNLLHLHLEPSVSLGADVSLLPFLFPALRCLRLRHREVPMTALLGLAQLEDLELLETQDRTPPSDKLISELRNRTNDRIQVCQKPEEDPRTCYCIQQLLRKDLR